MLLQGLRIAAPLFPRATSQAAVLARISGDCREESNTPQSCCVSILMLRSYYGVFDS